VDAKKKINLVELVLLISKHFSFHLNQPQTAVTRWRDIPYDGIWQLQPHEQSYAASSHIQVDRHLQKSGCIVMHIFRFNALRYEIETL